MRMAYTRPDGWMDGCMHSVYAGILINDKCQSTSIKTIEFGRLSRYIVVGAECWLVMMGSGIPEICVVLDL